MNLVNGKILDTKECDGVVDTLEQRISTTLDRGRLLPETVISACGKLVETLDESLYLDEIKALGIDPALAAGYIAQAKNMFSAESLRSRLKIELGEDYNKPIEFSPMLSNFSVTEQILPLGVLLHIAAGNVDGLPAFSVLEGLLAGNINILKLPAEEGGVSIRILLELIKIEPSLAEYIYVFDYSSKDIENISRLISFADAVVVWGGDAAVSAFRNLTPPDTRLIEWGHKISFAYVTKRGITTENLKGLARNICTTSQLFCSSCQGIFVDTDDMDTVFDFCEKFLPVLEQTCAEIPQAVGIGISSQITLQLYAQKLEGIYSQRRTFRGKGCSLTAYPDSLLTPCIQFGNAWVKPLIAEKIVATIRPYKNHLQTVGLLCADDERDLICGRLFKTGVVKISPPERMSEGYCGEPHDGEYPLRRYTKIVNIQK